MLKALKGSICISHTFVAIRARLVPPSICQIVIDNCCLTHETCILVWYKIFKYKWHFENKITNMTFAPYKMHLHTKYKVEYRFWSWNDIWKMYIESQNINCLIFCVEAYKWRNKQTTWHFVYTTQYRLRNNVISKLQQPINCKVVA